MEFIWQRAEGGRSPTVVGERVNGGTRWYKTILIVYTLDRDDENSILSLSLPSKNPYLTLIMRKVTNSNNGASLTKYLTSIPQHCQGYQMQRKSEQL